MQLKRSQTFAKNVVEILARYELPFLFKCNLFVPKQESLRLRLLIHFI